MPPKRKSTAPEPAGPASETKKSKSGLNVGDQFPDLGPLQNDEEKLTDLTVCKLIIHTGIQMVACITYSGSSSLLLWRMRALISKIALLLISPYLGTGGSQDQGHHLVLLPPGQHTGLHYSGLRVK